MAAATYDADLIRGSGTISKSLTCGNGLVATAAGTHSTRLRLQPHGRVEMELSIEIESRLVDGAGRVLHSGRQTNSETQSGTWTMTTKR